MIQRFQTTIFQSQIHGSKGWDDNWAIITGDVHKGSDCKAQTGFHLCGRKFFKDKSIWLNCLSSSNIHLIKVLKKLYEIFSGVWHDLGYSWEDLKDWMTSRHIPLMQLIHHVEVKFYYWYQIWEDSNLCSYHFNHVDQSCTQCYPTIGDWPLQATGRLATSALQQGVQSAAKRGLRGGFQEQMSTLPWISSRSVVPIWPT